jgi:hypothetical protein
MSVGTNVAAIAACLPSMRLLGLNLNKWKQWREVLAEERRNLGWRDWLGMVRLGLTIPFVADRKLWRSRLRICHKCPLFDHTLRRCRPYTGSPYGCGCWMPLKAITGPCWGRVHSQNGEFGWD